MRPVLQWFGGKFMMADWIIENLPEHRTYVEPFGGAASVLMQKARSHTEIYNDLDNSVVNLFRILQNKEHAEELERRLRVTPFARAEFDLAYRDDADPIEQARRLIIISFMGYGSDSITRRTKDGSFQKSGFRCRGDKSGRSYAGNWVNYADYLKGFSERLMGVSIENRDAFQVIEQNDSKETLFFLDPPYVHSTRTSRSNYQFEMTDSQHKQLIDLISGLKGMVVLCGYPNELYDSLGWRHISKPSMDMKSNIKLERLWLNEPAYYNTAQAKLF